MRFLKPAIGILTAVCLTSSMCIGSVFAAETIIDTSVGSEDEEVIQADYATFLEYDSSPMKAGETRTVRFYNPGLPTMTKMTAYEVSENITYVYEEGSDTLTITALATGNARMYIMGEGCAFGCYLNIEVVDDTLTTTTTTVAGAGTTTTTTTTTAAPDDEPITTSTAIADYRTFLDYDSSPMKAGETRTVRFYNPALPTMTKMTAYEVSENISYVYEEGSDTLTITALAHGNARIYIMGEGCAFGCYLNIEVVDDTLTSTTTTVAGEGTTTTTTVINNDEELPQTGYSNIYKAIAGFATLMTIGGAALVVKTRKENE